MREVDQALELMKEEYKRRMDFCDERRIQFESKQTKMRDNVIKFEKFIQENDAKRQRAELKMKQEKKIYDQKCQELNFLLERVKDLKNDQQAIVDEVRLWSPYSQFLTTFLESNTDQGFEEISDILKRYWTLRTSNESLLLNVRQQENEVGDIRTKLQILMTEKENSGLVNNSLMQHRQRILDNVRIQSKIVEQGTERETEAQKVDICLSCLYFFPGNTYPFSSLVNQRTH